LGQPVRQASALACEGRVCHPKKKERNKEKVITIHISTVCLKNCTLLVFAII